MPSCVLLRQYDVAGLFSVVDAQVCRPAGVNGQSAASGAGRYYTECDLAVGTILTIHQRQFELLNADEFTFQVAVCPTQPEATLVCTNQGRLPSATRPWLRWILAGAWRFSKVD